MANVTGDGTHFPSNWCIRQMRLFLLDTFCFLWSWRLYGLLTCGMLVYVFPRIDCRVGFCPLMGMVHRLSWATGHVFCFDLLCFIPWCVWSALSWHIIFWSSLPEGGPLYRGLTALSSWRPVFHTTYICPVYLLAPAGIEWTSYLPWTDRLGSVF